MAKPCLFFLILSNRADLASVAAASTLLLLLLLLLLLDEALDLVVLLGFRKKPLWSCVHRLMTEVSCRARQVRE
jgi:hypothetical protein